MRGFWNALHDPDWRETVGWVTGGVIALQLAYDLKCLGVPNTITPTIAIIIYVVIGMLAIHLLGRLAAHLEDLGEDIDYPEDDDLDEEYEDGDEPAHGWPVIRRLD